MDVADDGRGGGVAEPDQVVEVTAYGHAPCRGQVAGRDAQTGDLGKGAGQYRLLQTVGEFVLGVVETGAVECLSDEAGERGHDGAFLGRERAGVVVGEDAAADGPAGDDQRKEGPRLFFR